MVLENSRPQTWQVNTTEPQPQIHDSFPLSQWEDAVRIRIELGEEWSPNALSVEKICHYLIARLYLSRFHCLEYTWDWVGSTVLPTHPSCEGLQPSSGILYQWAHCCGYSGTKNYQQQGMSTGFSPSWGELVWRAQFQRNAEPAFIWNSICGAEGHDASPPPSSAPCSLHRPRSRYY